MITLRAARTWAHTALASKETLAREAHTRRSAELLNQVKAAEITGDLAAAGAILDQLAEHAPHDWKARCRRARIALRLKDLPQAKASAEAAALLQPREPEPWVILARVAGRKPGADALALWLNAAENSDLAVLASGFAQQAQKREGESPEQPAAAAYEPPAADKPGTPYSGGSPEEVVGLAQDFIRRKDMKPLFALLDGLDASGPDGTEIKLVKRYFDARVLFHHQCFEEAANSCHDLLDDPAAIAFLGSGIPSRRFDLASILARSLAILGRSAEAAVAAAGFADGSRDSLALDIDISWRVDPERALQAASTLLFRDDRRRRADIWFAHIPLTTGDLACAKSHLKVELLRNRERKARFNPELALCAAGICSLDEDWETQIKFFQSYFDHFALEFPQTDFSAPFSFERFDAAVEKETSGPLVTVIVTAFNAESTIDYALRSLLGQSHGNLEIIVVDDCSSDSTWAKLTSFADRDSRVVALRNIGNVGTHESKNAALKLARGDFYTCHDSDDWCHPRRIEHHVAFMERNPGLIASSSKWFRMDARGRPAIRPWHGKFTHLNPASVFCRMRVRDEIGFYDRVRIEADLEHWLRLGAKYGVDRIARLELPLAVGKSHTASLTRSGAGAQNSEGYSATRSHYRFEALKWRRRIGLDGDLYLPSPLDRRPFPVPPAIEVHQSTEQVRHSSGEVIGNAGEKALGERAR